MQMLHSLAVANGAELDWVEPGDPSEEIISRFEQLASMDLDL